MNIFRERSMAVWQALFAPLRSRFAQKPDRFFLTSFAACMLTVTALLAAIVLSGCSGRGASSAMPNAIAQQPGQASSNSQKPLGAIALPMSVVPLATTTGPYHIATYAMDIYGGEGGSASAASVTKLLTYAEDGPLDYKTLNDCHSVSPGCKTVLYMDPNHVIQPDATCRYYPDYQIIPAATESWFVHNTGFTDSSHRVYGFRRNGCQVWAMNPFNTSYQLWWRTHLRSIADSYDLYYLDDDYMMLAKEMYFGQTPGGCQPWPHKCHSTQEISDDAHMVLGHASFVNALTHSNGSPMYFIFQQASGNDSLDASAFTTTSRFRGMTCEGCISFGSHPAYTTAYVRVLDSMAAINAVGGLFVLSSQGNSPTGSATQTLQRLLTTGFVWLGYKEGFTAVWADLESQATTNLPVWPEDLIYPSQPLQTMRTGHSDLQVAPGVYRREFATCYQKGLSFGRCASIVNGNSTAITVASSWLRQTYHHRVTLSGGDVLSGGKAHRSGASFVANSTTMQAGEAILLTP